jgi:hypothetical protein
MSGPGIANRLGAHHVQKCGQAFAHAPLNNTLSNDSAECVSQAP